METEREGDRTTHSIPKASQVTLRLTVGTGSNWFHSALPHSWVSYMLNAQLYKALAE
jgi:hypothetical protein